MTVRNRRKALIRRDLNDLVRDPSGRVSEAKVFAVFIKTAMLGEFIVHIDTILKDWMILAIFVTALIAPDVFKKLIVMRAGK